MHKITSLFFLSFLFSISLYANDLNIDTIVKNANGKPLFLFFHKPHCGHCAHMIEFTLGDEEIKQEVENKFIFVDIYTQESGTVRFKDFEGSRRAFAQYFGYDFYPSSIFIDANKKMVLATPGAREQDFFIKVLDYVSKKEYQKMDFQTYTNNLDFENDD